MIHFTPVLIMAIITALTQFAYLLDDGRSFKRYMVIMVLYMIAIIMVLPESTPETFTIITIVFWALMLKRFIQQVIPIDYVSRNTGNNGFRLADMRKSIAAWETKRSNVLRYMLYCLALIIAQVVVIDYF